MTIFILQFALPIVVIAFASLVASGKVKVVWFPQPQQSLEVAEVTAPTKRGRGRPRKSRTHYLHLPPNLTHQDAHRATEFFMDYKDKQGDRVVLHLSTGEGEETIEIPYPVRWDDQIKERFSAKLGGWV